MNNRLGVLGWLYIIVSFFFTPGVMQLFYGGQLTANYLLNREVKTLELVRGMGGEVNQILRWKNAQMPSVTDLENVTGIGCEVVCLSCHRNTPIIDGSF